MKDNKPKHNKTNKNKKAFCDIILKIKRWKANSKQRKINTSLEDDFFEEK